MIRSRGRGATLLAVSIATFMLLLDVTVVSVALPAIQHEFRASFTDLQWVIDAYALALAALVLICGSLSDRLGRRRVFTTGLTLFVLASLVAGGAPSATILNLARVGQGAGGAAMLASGLALIAAAYPLGERRYALTVWGAIGSVALALGPLVGGLVVEVLDWRWVFLVNVPVGLATIGVVRARVPESRDPSLADTDWLGGALMAGAMAALVFALLRGNALGWSSPVILSLAAAAPLLLAAFALTELKVTTPILELSLLRERGTAGAAFAVFAAAASTFSMVAFISIYLQAVLAQRPLDTGLQLLPLTVTAFLATIFATRAIARIGPRWLLGAALVLCGAGLLAMRAVEPGSTWSTLLAGMCLAGFGMGIINPTVAAVALAAAPAERGGMASGINSSFRLLGMASGIAGLGALLVHRLTGSLVGLDPIAAERAFIVGFDEILLVAAGVAFAGAAAVLVLVPSNTQVS